MRTTVDLADDVVAAVARLRRERGLGLSEAINLLARASLDDPRPAFSYRPVTHNLGARVDLSNIGDVLELLDDVKEIDHAKSAEDTRRAG